MKTSQSSRGFTLIELLTVIAIIAVLMSMLAPTMRIATLRAQTAKAQSDVKQIDAALRSYYTEYGSYPVPAGAQLSGTGVAANYTYGDATGSGAQATNNYLFDVLRAYKGTGNTANLVSTENSRLVSFIDLPNVHDANNPKSGIAIKTVGDIPEGSFVDPWGKPYNVRIDAGYTNTVYLAPPYTNPNLSSGYLVTPVLVWSYGPDRAPGAGGSGDVNSPKFDDILSTH